MEMSVKPLELSNLFSAGIQIPKINKNVTMFMLCYVML